MGPRLAEWFDRSKFPATAKAPLGWGVEYWDRSASHYEGWEELRDYSVALGRRRTKSDLAADLSGNLLDDVLVAAGGVEKSINRLRAAVEELKQWVVTHGLQADPEVATGLGHEAAVDAWYAFADVISWARAVEERLDRPARRPKKFPRQGLVPALKPKRLRKRAEALLDQLRRGPGGETRFLANFTLHAALVRHPLSGAQLDLTGEVRLPIPDPRAGPVAHWHLFAWQQDRDGIAFAESVWQSIQAFIDDLLAAFEKGVPKRLKRSAAAEMDA